MSVKEQYVYRRTGERFLGKGGLLRREVGILDV